MKPAQTIKEARERAENRLLYEVSGKVREICEEFMENTGFSVYDVNFGLQETREIGSQHPTNIFISSAKIGYRDA
jgi:maleate cis-trans isomerase